MKALMHSRVDPRVLKILEAESLTVPVKLSELSRRIGVRVLASTLPVGISGELRNERGTFVVRVNRHDSRARQRFTVAHEIAHYLLHRDLIGNGIRDDALYRSALSDSLEREANALASEILMPEELVLERFYKFNSNDGDVVEQLATEFEVSVTAMQIRLNRLGMLV